MAEYRAEDLQGKDVKLSIGDTINYGDGGVGVVLPMTNDQLKEMREIAPGTSMFGSARNSSYDSFYDPEMIYRHQSRAAAISRSTPFGVNFFQDDISVADGIPEDATESMRLAQRYYREDPIAGKIIELMAQFSVAGFRHQLKDEKIRQFFDDWAIQVGFNQVLKQVFLEYYLSGNVYVMKTLVNFKQGEGNPDFKYKVDPNLQSTTKAEQWRITQVYENYEKAMAAYLRDEITYDQMKDIQADTRSKVMAARKHVWSKSMIPGVYTVIDPKAVTMDGAEEFGLATMTYKVSTKLKDTIQNPTTPYQKQQILTLPRDFVSQIRGGNDEVLLDPNIVSRITRMKPDYEPMAFPLMHRAFRALHMKNRLREMDSATIDTIITQMVIVKVGDKDFPAKPSHIQSLVQAWLEAMQTKTLHLFWNHAIDVIRVPVNMEILGEDKYEVWNQDIRDAFGVSPILLGRIEGSATTGYVSVKGFIENLEQGRQDVLEQFVYPEYHGIAAAMGFQGFPEVIFQTYNLRDEEMVKKVMMGLAQGGVLSYQTVVEELGYSWAQELERMTQEAQLKDDGTIRVMAPESSPGQKEQDAELEIEKQKAKPKNTENGPGGGRPTKQPTDKQPSRKPRLKDKTLTSK